MAITNSRLHGNAGQVALASVTIASLSKWDLNIAHDDAEVTSFGDTNKSYVRGLPDYKGNIAGAMDFSSSSPNDGNSPLFDAIEGGAAATLKLVPSSVVAANYWSGSAWLDGSVSVDVKGAVTIGASFKPAASDWDRAGA